jgi:pyroglutamyl-peptidase
MESPGILLLTGFEPFGGHAVNPSWEIARALHGLRVGSLVVHSVQLSCVFGESAQALQSALQSLQPRAVIALGLAASRHEISIERVALNVDDARIPDNRGQQPIDEPIEVEGPYAYPSSLPIKRIAAALTDAGWRAAVSQTAGTYVCNHVFYALMHAVQGQGIQAGFIHVPDVATPTQAQVDGVVEHTSSDRFVWTLPSLTSAIQRVLEITAAAVGRAGASGPVDDLRVTGGAID